MTTIPPPDTASGSPERFGFSWDTYAELRTEHEEQFRLWTAPLKPEDWRGKTFLDGGCGMGRNSYWPLRYGAARGVAIDVDQRTLSRARQTLAEFPNAEVKQTSIYDIPECDAFDIVFSIGVVHHMADPDAAVASLRALPAPAAEFWCGSMAGRTMAGSSGCSIRFAACCSAACRCVWSTRCPCRSQLRCGLGCAATLAARVTCRCCAISTSIICA